MLSKTSTTDIHVSPAAAERHYPHGEPSSQPAFPAFSSPGDQHRSKEEKVVIEDQKESEGSHPAQPDLFLLSFDKDFQEMLDEFLVPEQEQLHSLRRKLYKEIAERSDFPLRLVYEDVNYFRKRVYYRQVAIFSSPAGKNCYVNV